MQKFQQVASFLEKRIRHGDYLLKEVPSERELASEANVSHMTARKAILHLVEKGLLVRQPNKRLAVNRDSRDADQQAQIALLAPAFTDPYLELWHLWLSEMAREQNFFVRVIGYCHWDDTVIRDTMEGFDGTFLLPISDDIPESMVRQIKQANRPVVVLGQDVSEHKIPSLRITSPQMVQRLMDYLGELGHRHIDCINNQPQSQVIQSRIEQWQLWLAAHDGIGNLYNEPVQPYQSPMRGGYESARRLLETGELQPNTAIFCTTTASAMGVLRAIYEKGLQVGKDISVCSAEDGGDVAPYMTPSLTCLHDRDPRPYLGVCIEWMLRGGENWIGPLAVQPADAIVFHGETAGLRKI